MSVRGTVESVSLALLVALTVCQPSPRDARAQESRDQVLPGCGICYPDGYDINTVGEVEGRILDVQASAEGPVRLFVAGEREKWVVLASPVRFWKCLGVRLAPGDSVTARGSKSLGADGTLYLIAREIRPAHDAPVAVLRDRQGIPLWSGSRRASRISGGESDDCRGAGKGRNRR